MTIVMTMVISTQKTLSASAFKAQCLALMDEVERTGVPVTITKHGRPVAQLAPARPGAVRLPVFGLHKGRLVERDPSDIDRPVVDPSAWSADADNIA
jgi:prevent-host-death family protein